MKKISTLVLSVVLLAGVNAYAMDTDTDSKKRETEDWLARYLKSKNTAAFREGEKRRGEEQRKEKQKEIDDFLYLCRNGKTDKVKEIINENPNFLNARGNYPPVPHQIAGQDTTALIQATLSNNRELVEWLVKEGSDLLAIQENGETALLEALYNENSDLASYLFKKTRKQAKTNKSDNKEQLREYLASFIRQYHWIESRELSSVLSESYDKGYHKLTKEILSEISCNSMFRRDFGHIDDERIKKIDSYESLFDKMVEIKCAKKDIEKRKKEIEAIEKMRL